MRLYCKKHPEYKAKRYPSSGCLNCRVLWDLMKYPGIKVQGQYPESHLEVSSQLIVGRRK